jgi:uncharacterized membrane protein YbhN (UPF0104 family)
MLRYTVVSVAASAVAPARAGDVVRWWLIRRNHGVSSRYVGTVVAFEKLFDVSSLLLLVAPVPWLVATLPPWVSSATRVLSTVAVLAVVLVISLGRSTRLRALLHAPSGGPLLALSFLPILGAWLVDLAEVALVLFAVGVAPTWVACALVLLGINFAIAIPATPGHAGTLELGAVAALQIMGVSPDRAAAFAILYHAMQLAPVVLVGLIVGRGALSSVAREEAAKEAIASKNDAEVA